MSSVLVTGGAGFIGCNFVRFLVKEGHEATVLDKLTYAGSMENLKDVKGRINFIKGDIAEKRDAEKAIKGCEIVVNFAAETHVDRSIQDPEPFIRSNVFGMHALLDAARRHDVKKFIHISTDEVYGSAAKGFFIETDTLSPRNPYSATKAAAEQLGIAYANTYGIKLMITRSSNNYGPYQNAEKFIPKMITNALQNKQMPIYGAGKNIRDWIFVEDNCTGILAVIKKGRTGEIYNIGGGNEKRNIDAARTILKILGKPESLLTFVADRPGHDFRYALDTAKARKLGWKPAHTFEAGMKKTIEWYKNNTWFWQ
ncbi:MAG: dTDP-glucose 4,6-dehydratase [Candidatus Aenigmarchaeota archaeon]|nr:dTDP-glucose 4,6-dehydratase [Candidatus Aenigmarchaeota archaeon]